MKKVENLGPKGIPLAWGTVLFMVMLPQQTGTQHQAITPAYQAQSLAANGTIRLLYLS